MLVKVIERVAEMIQGRDPSAVSLWKALLESPQLATCSALIQKHYAQYAIDHEDLAALRNLVSSYPDFVLTKEGRLVQAIVSCTSGQDPQVSGLKVPEFLILYEFLEGSTTDAR